MHFGSAVVVIVPARDEGRHIGGVVRSMPAMVDEVIVVDDGSRDDTFERAAEAAAQVAARVTFLRHARPMGVGRSIVAGYRAALAAYTRPGDVFVVMAGDGQMHPADLAAVVDPVAHGHADYTKGNRLSWPGVEDAMPWARRLGTRIFSSLTSVATGRTVHDSQCGYTALSRRACSTLPLERIWHGFGYPNDLLARLVESGARIAEVPVRPLYGNEESHLRVWHLPAIFRLLMAAWWRRVRARRRPEHGPARGPAGNNPRASLS
jgi:glycosyltransferase involved in cell wall biosynthesis